MRETGNIFDPFAVAVVRDGEIINHMLRLILAACSLFLRHSGSIACKVIHSRQHLKDLPQGGLEIPCTLTFEGDEKFIEKVKKLMKLTDCGKVHDADNSSQLIAATEATPMPVVADTSSIADDSCSFTILVEDNRLV